MKLAFIGLTLSAFITANAFAAAPTLTPTEMNTLATIATIDQSEIVVSTVACNKAKDNDLEHFAKLMIKQHSENLTQILSMVNNSPSYIQDLTSGTAATLASANRQGLAQLGALQNKQFDLAYANAMVNGHTAALHLIDTQLMQTAQSSEMKKFLKDTRNVVAEHLEHAKNLQKELNS